MNPMRVLSLLACLAVAAMAGPTANRMDVSQALKPSQWLSAQQLENIPAVDDLTLERLESMSLDKGAELLQQVYHLSQINHDVEPNYMPGNVQVYVPKPNGDKIVAPINEMIHKLKQQQQQQQRNFGQDEVTIIVTGLPQTTETVQKATRKLVEAYMQRYNLQQQQQQGLKYQTDASSEENTKRQRSSSEEDYSEQAKNANTNTGDIIVIDLGSDYLLNSPLPSRPSMACMVKVYEDFDKYTLNSLMDFVGFLSVDPALDAATLDVEDMQDVESFNELQAKNPSPFLIPRLHAFGVKQLPHANPLLDQSLQQPAAQELPTPLCPETVHKDLRMVT